MVRVLIDISYLAYRALHAVGDLEFDDVPTGIIFGFFHQLRQVCMDDRVRSNRVFIFCDSRSSLRAKEYPEYKQKRQVRRTEDEIKRIRTMRRQIDMLTEKVLQKIGFPVYSQEGLESDDLIAWAARRISRRAKLRGSERREAVIVTSDGDLLQCISPWVHWFDPQRNIYLNESLFSSGKGQGLVPRDWSEVKAIGGCSSDNVTGVPGVGETTAIRYLLGELPPTYKTHQAIISPAGRRIIERNRPLVQLPHSETRPFLLKDPEYNIKMFFRYCHRYGLMSIIRDRQSWESFFRGSPFRTRKPGESRRG